MVLNGIDVSSFQTGINLSAVPSDFVFIKATEGVGYVSPACNAQTASAQKVGKKVGWYHFANVGNAVQQADYFVNNISNYVHHGILMLDWEANAVYQGVGWAKAWLDHVYQRTGVRPIIYMSKALFISMIGHQLLLTTVCFLPNTQTIIVLVTKLIRGRITRA
ncbi:hypothetical protein Q757_08160 [Oenococcus alcoholitolerans]|uniref:Lysozyme n=1 Tax=Oenococcus alcoholitolerans TaxID=931074 RepID=A0ABR4XPD9_9LACO|nr:hypothetical protein Q757_08160 [Oenococcus alcoholitolerans]